MVNYFFVSAGILGANFALSFFLIVIIIGGMAASIVVDTKAYGDEIINEAFNVMIGG
ncbi:MAG: hypothetical protein ACJAX7_000812 [Saprospiraceae bacterium]